MLTPAQIETLNALQAATFAARVRLDDTRVATRVDAGKIQVIRATPVQKGRFDITPLSDWLPPAEAVAFLEGL